MYDVMIIGGGPGGYVAAIRASQLGLKTALVEREHLGGICLNWGCIPTKALLRSSDAFHLANRSREFGLRLDAAQSQDIGAVVQRSRKIAGQLNAGVAYLLKKNDVQIIVAEASVRRGEVEVRKPHRITNRPQMPFPKDALADGTYSTKHIIVATGASPRVIPNIIPDGRLIWTYYEAMVPPSIPKSLIIVGSGAIGIEFATFYRTMGSEVTLVELQDRIMPAEDKEISTFVRKRLERRGIKILLSSSVDSVQLDDDCVAVDVLGVDGACKHLVANRLISAVGAVANSAGLGLEELGVELKDGFISVDGYGKTNIEGIYAIGDAAGMPMLAHKAEHQGVICVEAIAGHPTHGLDMAMIPACTYGDPQVASIGLTQDAAERAGIELKIGRFPFAANGKAIALGEGEGMVKTLFDAATGKLVGAHMVGAEVTELIQGYAIAMTCGATLSDLQRTVFPHPTISEIMHEASLQADGRAIHV